MLNLTFYWISFLLNLINLIFWLFLVILFQIYLMINAIFNITVFSNFKNKLKYLSKTKLLKFSMKYTILKCMFTVRKYSAIDVRSMTFLSFFYYLFLSLHNKKKEKKRKRIYVFFFSILVFNRFTRFTL